MATQDRATAAAGQQAQLRLAQFEIDRNVRDREIYRLNRLIDEHQATRTRSRPRPRRSPFTIGQPELVALAQNARNVAIQAENIARRSASAPRARF